MLVKRIVRSYPSIFNRFPVIQHVSSQKFAILGHFLHILASLRYAHGIIADNVTWMKRGFNARQTHRSIYPSIFNRLRAIARCWLEIATFFYPLHNAPVGVFPLEFWEKFWSP